MAQYAPELPLTSELADTHPLSSQAEVEIVLARERISSILSGRAAGLVAVLGPCAMNEQVDIIAREGDELRELTAELEGLYAAHRMPVWKPRTNPEDWHGRETTDPHGAYQTLARQANHGTGVSIEIAHMPHAERYADLTVLDWFGGRNVGKGEMMDEVAMRDPSLPLAVKNGLDGTIDGAMQHVDRLNHLRGADAAPVVLLYRGGENAKDPSAWEAQYRQAMEATNGNMIVDVAHGSEMAHHPDGTFKKSVPGQIAALEHVIAIAEEHGELPAGIMAEASEADSPTDPHMPFNLAIEGVRKLLAIRMNTTVSR
jgi:phospho-2-dehydro-3-deoxyheptonate aldolase